MLKNEAIGAYEAAGLLGVHFTRPKRMADAGELSSREVGSGGGVSFSVYSARECDENFSEYESSVRSKKKSGAPAGRPRAFLHERPLALARLKEQGRPQIQFEDAIGVTEAAKILGVFPTSVVRVAQEGKIVGRILWSERGGRSKLWIFSRLSCEARAAENSRLEASGAKLGRPRNAVAGKKPKPRKK